MTSLQVMPRFISALFLTALLSCAAALVPCTADRFAYPLHGWTWWSAREVRAKLGPGDAGTKQNVLLLGSSLMVVAMAESDATWSHQRIDLTTYRDARYFDDRLNTASSKRPSARTINLSAPGQIPSDAYLTMKFALASGLRPNLVVYGIAPRDLLDSTLSSPFDTECYKYLCRLVSADELNKVLPNNCWQRISRQFNSASPLLQRSIDFQLQTDQVANMALKALSERLHLRKISLAERMLLLKNYKPLEMEPEFIHAEIAVRGEVEKLYSDNLSDYVARYRKPRLDFYEGELAALKMLAELCQSEHIEFVLVNMPIRKCNADLIEPGVQAAYLSDLFKLSRSCRVRFYDLCDYKMYQKDDFRDSVHLNGFGGMKFIDKLADVLVHDRLLLSSSR